MSYSDGEKGFPFGRLDKFSVPITRRNLLKSSSLLGQTALSIHWADNLVNTVMLWWKDELRMNGFKEKYVNPEAVKKLMEGGEVTVGVYVMGDNQVGGRHLRGERYWDLARVEDKLNSTANSLGNGEFNAYAASVDAGEEILDVIEDNTVKSFRGEPLEEVGRYLEGQGIHMDHDVEVIVGDFKSGLGEFSGSCVGEGVVAVCNKYSPEYVVNEINHNVGHIAGGLGHTRGAFYLNGASYMEPMSGYGAVRNLVFANRVLDFKKESEKMHERAYDYITS